MKPGDAMAAAVEASEAEEPSDFDASVDDFGAALAAKDKQAARMAFRAAVMACMDEDY